jgi:hypothetical protein
MSAALFLAADPHKPYRTGQQRRIAGRTVMIHSVQALTLGDVTHDQARALGHKGTAAFKRAWVAAHDKDWASEAPRGDAETIGRFTQRWGPKEAVFVAYAVIGAPRFMARNPSNGPAYTTSAALSIDPSAECVPADTQERYSKDALGFCLGRQLARAQNLTRDQAIRKGEKRPYPRAA